MTVAKAISCIEAASLKQHFTAYIDEAGDEGFGKLATKNVGGQSRWLILGACIVSRENDAKLPGFRNQILARFPKRGSRDLHFRNLKHEQKIVVCQELAKLRIGACLALSHKVTIPGSKHELVFKQKGFLYNYLVRWLLERITTACAKKAGQNECSLKLVFSRRGGTDYRSMRAYLELMRDGREKMRPVRSINWSILDLDAMVVENHSKWAGLQIADCITSAFFAGVEPNTYGNYEQTYGKLLKAKLIRHSGTPLNAGLTVVPSVAKSQMDALQTAFIESFGNAPEK